MSVQESNMYKFYRWPNPARGEFSRPFGGIVEVLRHYSRFLPVFGGLEVTEEEEAELVVGHLGTKTKRLDVFHLHGLMPTAEYDKSPQDFEANRIIIDNIRRARRVICVSNWVADMLRRDMHMQPDVVGHGFDWEVWHEIPPAKRGGTRPRVLWNKTRNWGVCDPTVVIELAKRLPNIDFVTTFVPNDVTNVPSNVLVTGLLARWDAWGQIKASDVYLGTTKETFGVGALEAMASSIPVVGFLHGATPEVVGDVGLFVHPGDYGGLARKVVEALDRKKELGDLGFQLVKTDYSWSKVVRRISDIYMEVLRDSPRSPRVTVVIPCYNRAKYIGHAIRSVMKQTYKDWELFVVDDASTDDSADVIREVLAVVPNARLIKHSENRGVAHARNTGISRGTGEYVWCLDADDGCEPDYLQTMVNGIQKDPRLAIVYTGLKVMDAQGNLRSKEHTWPLPFKLENGLKGNQIPTSCLYKRVWWERLGGYRQRYAPHGAGQEDADFWFRVLANGGGAEKVSEKGLFHYRFHAEQITRMHRDDWDKDTFTGWYPFVADGKHPLASQLGVPLRGSWHVRNYDTPRVVVVVPVGPRHTGTVVDALDSVEAQTYRNWELVVVNDTGEDRDFSAWPYAKVVKTTGSVGPAIARNLGYKASIAPLVVFLDADDFLEPKYLEETLNTWKADQDFWVYTDLYQYKTPDKREEYNTVDWNLEQMQHKGLAGVTCLYGRNMLDDVGGFDETPGLLHEDWDLHVRLVLLGHCGYRVPLPLYTYRTFLGQRRADGIEQKGAQVIRDRYTKEEVMGCGCRKKAPRTALARTVPTRSGSPTSSPASEPKGETGWPTMEYTGPVHVTQVFRGRGGRSYLFGNNVHHKTKKIHPDDVARLSRKAFLTVVKEG